MSDCCQYYIDFPGTEDNAPTLPTSQPYPTIQELAKMVEEVLAHYKAEKKTSFMMGVGFGANVALEYTLTHKDTVLGQVLVAFDYRRMGYVDYAYYKELAAYTYYQPQHVWNFDQLAYRYFAPKTRLENEALLGIFAGEVARINMVNLSLMIGSYCLRPDTTERLPSLRARTLLFCGRESYYYDATCEFFSVIGKDNGGMLEFQDTAGLLTEESPFVFAQPLKYFFQGFGMLIPHIKVKARHQLSTSEESESLESASPSGSEDEAESPKDAKEKKRKQVKIESDDEESLDEGKGVGVQ